MFAAGGAVNYYSLILHGLGIHDAHAVHEWMAVLSSLLGLSVLTLFGVIFRSNINKLGENIAPARTFSIATLCEMLMEFVYDLCQSIIGSKQFKPFLSLMTALFLYILFINLSGLVPGFPPATESINTNLAMGVMVFVVYNIAGIKENGLGNYLAHFLGPKMGLLMIVTAPMLLLIEGFGHLARPVSLSLRLIGNIFGDHLVVGVFSSFPVFQWFVPGLFLFFGLLVACIQSFVFTLLSGIYISMAVAHDH